MQTGKGGGLLRGMYTAWVEMLNLQVEEGVRKSVHRISHFCMGKGGW